MPDKKHLDKVKPNLLKPRWSKVFSDLWDDKTRTALVVASIAVGVFAIGMIISSLVILREEINANYAAANPPNIVVWTDPFYENFVRVIEKIPGIGEAEGRRIMTVRIRPISRLFPQLRAAHFPQKSRILSRKFCLVLTIYPPFKRYYSITYTYIPTVGM